MTSPASRPATRSSTALVSDATSSRIVTRSGVSAGTETIRTVAGRRCGRRPAPWPPAQGDSARAAASIGAVASRSVGDRTRRWPGRRRRPWCGGACSSRSLALRRWRAAASTGAAGVWRWCRGRNGRLGAFGWRRRCGRLRGFRRRRLGPWAARDGGHGEQDRQSKPNGYTCHDFGPSPFAAATIQVGGWRGPVGNRSPYRRMTSSRNSVMSSMAYRGPSRPSPESFTPP